MKICCCQFDISWEAKQVNFEKVRSLLERAAPVPGSLIVLPEMTFSGFSMNVARSTEDEPACTEAFLTAAARRFGVYLLAGVVTQAEDGLGQNKAMVVTPSGEITGCYQKIRLFSPGGEHLHFQPGDKVTTFPWQGGCITPFICYDLRFPELFRAALPLGAELYIVIANWPAARERHWLALLQARAIENQAYVAGANRCGRDPQNYYSGRSVIIAPDGEFLADAGQTECLIWAEVDWNGLRDYRARFPVLADRHGICLGALSDGADHN